MDVVSTQTLIAELDRRIRERSILQHPFYRAWSAGELSRADLAAYAEVYYPHVAAFPRYLETALAGAADVDVRAELAANLAEERGVPAPHPELWLDFAAAMGADRAAVQAAPADPEVAATVAAFDELCARGTDCAAAALYAYEGQQPEVSAAKLQGLRDFYGIADGDGTRYFEVHAEADVRHREGHRAVIARCLEAGASGDEVLAAADRALDAYWGLLDAVMERTGRSTSMAC